MEATRGPHSFLDLRNRLREAFEACGTCVPYVARRYDPGDILSYRLRGVGTSWEASATFRVLSFAGGGFAGQVYQVLLEGVEGDDHPLEMGARYALKILRPPSRAARWVRDALFGLGYQAPFAPQVWESAARAQALWHFFIRRAAGEVLGSQSFVCQVYATLYDATLRSFGVLNEWVDGRCWKLEVDDRLFQRWKFRGDPPQDHPSAEYVAKRLFMRGLVKLMREMGAPELSRQYEWWTCKSQPNVLQRFSIPGSRGLVAIDFSPGLTLLPFLPMSPADFCLILRGLARGRLVQFDGGDLARLEGFVRGHPSFFHDTQPALEELRAQESLYRASLPDLFHRPLRDLTHRRFWSTVRQATVSAWERLGLVDEPHAGRLARSPALFGLWWTLAAIPWLGPTLLRVWGDGILKEHLGRCLRSAAYLARALRAYRASTLIEWVRAGRLNPDQALRLLDRPWRFALQRVFLAWLPPSCHRGLVDPGWVWSRLKASWAHVSSMLKDPSYRERNLLEEVRRGREEGMLTPEEEARVVAQIRDPFIQKYLTFLAVHLCTLPITQVVMLLAWFFVAVYCTTVRGMPWAEGLALGATAAATIQILPISPGSLARGLFVVYRMIRERDVKSYYIAAPVSFIHVVGYLAFPFQMVAHDPALARFLAGRWARRMVHLVPVFGEKGALLEHAVFDLFFNLPLSLGRMRRKRRAGPPSPPPSSEG